jgi:DMSO/TMAO reductase YedYZ molybdopterin-dependent catalytic subunit
MNLIRSFPDRPISRRELLRHSAFLGVGLALTPLRGWPESWFDLNDTVVPFTDVPANFTGRRPTTPEPYPGANLIAQDLRELTDWITPDEDFFVVTHYGIPELDDAAHRLELSGLVDRPLSLTMDDLRRLPAVERTTVFECGGNSRAMFHGMVGNARWTGIDLVRLIEEAGPTVDAREVHFWGADSGEEEIRGNTYRQFFGRSMSLAEVEEARPILAYAMNGEPLPIVHGFPLRLVVPGWYGVAHVKWLQRIDLATERLMTRFMARDYVTLMAHERNGETEWVETSVARQRPKSVIARVTRNGDDFRICGAAWTDGTSLGSVEVRIDDGDWVAAELERPDDPVAWTFFTFTTRGLAPGDHSLVSRATDARGRTQPDDLSTKVTRWENNELFHRTIRV